MSITASIISAIVSSIIETIVDAPETVPAPANESMIVRNFPAGAKKGIWTSPIQQGVIINGITLPVAPGLQIRGQDNLIILPVSLQTSIDFPVRYQLDPMGNVWRLWIISAAEFAAPEPQQ